MIYVVAGLVWGSASPFLCWLCCGLTGCFSDTFCVFLCSFVCFLVVLCGGVRHFRRVCGCMRDCVVFCFCAGCGGRSVRSLWLPVFLMLLMFGRIVARVPECAGFGFGCLLRESIDIRAQRFGYGERETCSWLSVCCTTGA